MTQMPDDRQAKTLLEWLGAESKPQFTRSRALGGFVGFVLILIFGAALGVALLVLFDTARNVFTAQANGPNLGAGALITALLGAPFLIWTTIIKHRSLGFQKEGHLTDRISKAVEQLGAEKKVDRIGRPVTIWTGEVERFLVSDSHASEYLKRPRARVVSRDWTETFNPSTDEVVEGYVVSISIWASERTVIEWQGDGVPLDKNETVGAEGDWKVFSESVPNIEVRIGGILSLERIAQDSTEYDNARDHVRVMEILCAYIRQNAPASEAKDHGFGEWEPLKDGATEEERAEYEAEGKSRFGRDAPFGRAHAWAQLLPEPRADISIALRVIGRRSPAQRRAEAHWGIGTGAEATWVFDHDFEDRSCDPETRVEKEEIESFRARLRAWKDKADAYRGYRLDLRKTNLQRADLSDLCLSGGKFEGARLEGVYGRFARFEACTFFEARLDGADFQDAHMRGAKLGQASLDGVDLARARLQGADFAGAVLQGANLKKAQMQSASFHDARLEFAGAAYACLQGASFSQACLDWADFHSAGLEFASLSITQADGTNFFETRFSGTWLWRANLQRAFLCSACFKDARLEEVWLEGAELFATKLDGSHLSFVKIDSKTNFNGTSLVKAALRHLDLSQVNLSCDQVDSAFGDGSVKLPAGITPRTAAWPQRWPVFKLGMDEFSSEWRKWQASPETYRPPQPPTAL